MQHPHYLKQFNMMFFVVKDHSDIHQRFEDINRHLEMKIKNTKRYYLDDGTEMSSFNVTDLETCTREHFSKSEM